MDGFSADNLTTMVEKVTSGATEAIGEIEMEGYDSDDLSGMIEKVTSGATGALDQIQISGYDAADLSSMVEKITAGSTKALGKIKMTGFDKDDISGMVEKITTGSTKALGEIKMDGYSSDNLTTMLEKVTEGATGALGEINIEGLDESEFQSLVTKIGDGQPGLGEIRMDGYDHLNPTNELKDKILQGTSEGLTKIKSTTGAAFINGVSSSKDDGTYGSGVEILIQVNFSSDVFVEGTPGLLLETGQVDRSASYASGTGSSTLVFSYITQASDITPDLDYASPASLVLNGGSIKDASGKKAMILLPPPGTKGHCLPTRTSSSAAT